MKKVTVSVLDIDDLCDVPESPAEFMAFWQACIDRIPAEYIDTAAIRLEPWINFDVGAIEFSITYTRPETEKEKTARENKEQEWLEYEKRHALERFEMIKKKHDL